MRDDTTYRISDGLRVKLGLDLVNPGNDTVDMDEIMYRLMADSGKRDLLTEPASMFEIEAQYSPGLDFVFEELTIKKFSETEKRIGIIVRLFNKKLKDKNKRLKEDGKPEIIALTPAIGKPRKSGMIAVATVEIPFSDGQSIFIVFHSPDNDENKITAADEIIAFRWMLNKRDITHVISPEEGKDIPVRQLADRIAKIVVKNSVQFQKRQAEVRGQKQKLTDITDKIESINKEKELMTKRLRKADSEAKKVEAKAGVSQSTFQKIEERVENLRAEVEDLKIRIEARKKEIAKASTARPKKKAATGKIPKKKAEPRPEDAHEAELVKLATEVLDRRHDHLPLDELLDMLTPVFEDLDPEKNEELFRKLDEYTTEKTLEAAKAA